MRHILIATSVPLLLALAAMSTSQDRQPVQARKPRLPLTVSKTTTFFTGPLRENGSVDYVEALNRHYGKGVAPENNAVVPLLRAFGGKEIPKTARAEFYRRLGIKPLPDAGVYVSEDAVWAGKLTGNAKRAAEKQWDEETEKAHRGPWTAADCPLVAKWLAANAKTFNLIEGASRRTKWFIPLVPNTPRNSLRFMAGTRFAGLTMSRKAGGLLNLRATLHLGNGRVDLAIHDLLAGQRLARLLDRDRFLIGSLVGHSIEMVIAQGVDAVALSGKMSFRQADNFRRDVEKLGLFKGIPESWRVGERCLMLDYVVELFRNPAPGSSFAKMLPDELRVRWDNSFADRFELDTVLKSSNAFYDRVVRISKIRDPEMRRQAKARFREKVAVVFKRANRPSDLAGKGPHRDGERQKASVRLSEAIIATDGNIYDTAMTAEDRANTRYDLTRVALALAAYRAERGKFPERLPAVVPRYIPALPVDRFSGKPLKYRLTKKAFLLYSVGENGRDDGGKLGGGPDDIAVGG